MRELKTWISEDAGPAAALEPLMDVAPYFQVSLARACEIVGEVERAVADWRARGRALGMTNVELDAFAVAFEHDERTVARRIRGGT